MVNNINLFLPTDELVGTVDPRVWDAKLKEYENKLND